MQVHGRHRGVILTPTGVNYSDPPTLEHHVTKSIFLLSIACLTLAAAPGPSTRLLRNPTVSSTQIAFAYADA